MDGLEGDVHDARKGGAREAVVLDDGAERAVEGVIGATGHGMFPPAWSEICNEIALACNVIVTQFIYQKDL